MTVTQQTTPDGTLELTMTVPWETVQKTFNEVKEEVSKNVEVPGFRKGKAPQKMVEERLDETKIYEHVLEHLVPEVYNNAVQQAKVRPLISPKIELKEAKNGSDWVIIARTCQRPKVTVGDYKASIAKAKGEAGKKIWTPGEEKKEEEKEKKPSLDVILSALLSVITVSIPKLLIDHEVNRLLSELIDQTKQLGLTVEQYLASSGRNAKTIREEYQKQAERTLTLEFGLEEVADKEGILVSDDDINKVISSAKTEEERKGLERERYYLASILRRQKTLDFLSSL